MPTASRPPLRASLLLALALTAASCGAPPPPAQPPRAPAAEAPPTPAAPASAPPVDPETLPAAWLRSPADAKTSSAEVTYKQLVSNPAGAAPGRNDTVVVHHSIWEQDTGERLLSSRARGVTLTLQLPSLPSHFADLLQRMREGERVRAWLPSSVVIPGREPSAIVLELELLSIKPAPAIPAELSPPAGASALSSGTRYVVVRPGRGAPARVFDRVVYHYTVWDESGRMLDSTETSQKPASHPAFRKWPALAEVLTSFPAGHRIRFWVDADKWQRGSPGLAILLERPPTGQVTYELEILEIDPSKTAPPPTPADVAAAPAGAKKSPRGVPYKVLKAGKGPKPGARAQVRVSYTGWTTDGHMFDTSAVNDPPWANFSLDGVIAGFADAIQQMAVGSRWRFWIPEALAYKGARGKPPGTLVFELELLEILPDPPSE